MRWRRYLMVPTYHQLLVSMTGTDVPPASGINDWLADAPDAAVRPGGHSSVTIVTQRHAIARRHAPRRALRRRGRTTAAQLGKRPTTSLRRRISGSRRASRLFDQTCRQSATRQAVKPSRSPGPSARPLPPPGESRPTGMLRRRPGQARSWPQRPRRDIATSFSLLVYARLRTASQVAAKSSALSRRPRRDPPPVEPGSRRLGGG